MRRFGALSEDFSPRHPVTRRMTYEAQNAAFAETRRRGIVPAGELARFWCIADCDYYFFTDWSSDRLANTPVQGAPAPVGEPVPLFQLVFHDCFAAGFSGGGYALYSAGYDWWADRTPRLYELLYACCAGATTGCPVARCRLATWGGACCQRSWPGCGAGGTTTARPPLRRWSGIAFCQGTAHCSRWSLRTACGPRSIWRRTSCAWSTCPGFSGEWEQPEQLD